MNETQQENYKTLSKNVDDNKLNRLTGFGKHAALKIKDLPESYCVWMYHNTKNNGTNNDVRWRGEKLVDALNKKVIENQTSS